MKIEQMRTCHLENPLGLQMEYPVFSWKVRDTTAKKQSWARVQVFREQEREPVWDSGEDPALRAQAVCAKMNLLPCTRYRWTAEVLADSGERASGEAWFETGLRESGWQAKWIAAPDRDAPPCFRKCFTVPDGVRRARLYILGLGLYEAYLNGARVGADYLTPGCCDYRLWLPYQIYDVTRQLRPGRNALGVLLGDGWYRGRLGFDGGAGNLFGSRLQLLAQLRLELADGSVCTVGSDESWRCAPSFAAESSIYDGERFDARLILPGWASADTDESRFGPVELVQAPAGRLTERLGPPVRIAERWPVRTLFRTPKGELVADAGQEISGWAEFDCALPSGGQVTLRYGELLQDGCFYQGNLRTARQTFTYLSDGRPRHVRPHFTFFGFRYVQIGGLSEQEASSLVFCVLHSELDRTGRLETSDPDLNRLVQNSEWSQLDNFVDLPTDCPQRDERLGWTGDAQVYCATACLNRDSAAFYRKYLYDLRQEQRELGGNVPHVVPDVVRLVCRAKGLPEQDTRGSCAWSDAAAIIPWTLYVCYGDPALLREEYGTMRDWAEWLIAEDEAHGAPRLRLWGFHFADWLALDNPDPRSCFGGTDPFYIASAYYFWSLSLTAKAADALGLQADAARYARLALEVRAAIRRRYFTPEGDLTVGTQTGLALALAMGLAPEDARGRLTQALGKKLAADGHSLQTGFVGTYFLCSALAENGLADEAYALLFRRQMPGWLYEVDMGATTIWERWNSILPDGHVSDTGMNSLNHYAYGAILEWMYRYLCGLRPLECAPGFAAAELRPLPTGRLEYARASYDSASGLWRCGWARRAGGIDCEITVPFGASAVFYLPGGPGPASIGGRTSVELSESGWLRLDAGEYRIRAEGK